MDTVAIIQARMGSTRLPGKVLADIDGKPMLERIIRRVRDANSVQDVVVATTAQLQDRAIEVFCKQHGVPCFRGPANDVLARYLMAGMFFDARVIVRVTADCPLIDSVVIDDVVDARFDVDYACTAFGQWPNGVDAEAFTLRSLCSVHYIAHKPHHREHVTPYYREQTGQFSISYVNPIESERRPDMRWTVDEQADLDFIREVYRRGWNELSMGALIKALDGAPDVMAINAHVRQKDVTEC
jgi:spore coat polysaccharide biosynthesis protein SpsF